MPMEWFVAPRDVPEIGKVQPAVNDLVKAYSSGLLAPRGKFWVLFPRSQVEEVILIACELIAQYLRQAPWSDDVLAACANSKLAALFASQYNSVHDILKEDHEEKQAYQRISPTVQSLEGLVVDYLSDLDDLSGELECMSGSGDRQWSEGVEKTALLMLGAYEAAAVTIEAFRSCVQGIALDAQARARAERKQEAGRVEPNIAPIKCMLRALEKVVLRPGSGTPWDLNRAQFICEKCAEIVTVLEIMREQHVNGAIQLVQVNDRFREPASGWADVSLYFYFPGISSLICEVQVVHQKMYVAREELGAHDQYSASAPCEWRSGGTLSQ